MSVEAVEEVVTGRTDGKRLSSLSLVSISELDALQDEMEEMERNTSKFSLSEGKQEEKSSKASSRGEEDEATVEDAIRSNFEDNSFDTDLDVIGGIRDSLQAKHAKQADFKKFQFGNDEVDEKSNDDGDKSGKQ
eukprot:CAMPEP_0172440484 /NCGR_PEP_ID=MMETSP1065-20121228/1104_1 /TAXON_ID=265537 /ORGANISM="Amphiprora paludosa, Strain CCMP125" /LENGTH=133 /DNA_ID=CAMNT_0013189329 /DNA_START=116 /DNA_END=517 /DNA_ORIENTATION=+